MSAKKKTTIAPGRASEPDEKPFIGGVPSPASQLRPREEEDVETLLEGDELANELGSTSVREMTGEEDTALFKERDQILAEELGGPFEITTGAEEFTDDDPEVDETWTREPFPRSHGD